VKISFNVTVVTVTEVTLNEIDVVAINDMEKRIVIAETKLNKSKIKFKYTQRTSTEFIKRLSRL